MWTMLALGILLALFVAARILARLARKESEVPVGEDASYRDQMIEEEKRENAKAASQIFGWVSWGVLVLLLLVLAANSVKIVGANEVGVPRTLGKIGSPLQSGPHLVAPWTEVEKLPTRPRTVTTVTNIRTSQSGHAAIRIATRWNTDKQDASELYQQARTSDEEKIEKDIIKPQVDGAANEYYGALTNKQATVGTNWTANATGLQVKVQQRLQKYGIHLVDVEIREANPDRATNVNLEQVSAQERLSEVADKSNVTAQKQATQRKTEATGIKDAAAELKDLTPTQIQLLCLQAAERVMNENVAKGIPTYVTPCGGATTSVIAK